MTITTESLRTSGSYDWYIVRNKYGEPLEYAPEKHEARRRRVSISKPCANKLRRWGIPEGISGSASI